jgi:hypothetical protein
MRAFLRFSAALGWGFFTGIWGSGKCQFQNGRAADILFSFEAFTFCNDQHVNRRRRLLTIVGCGLVALLAAMMFSARPKESVPMSAIVDVHEALMREGFNMDRSQTAVDEIALPRIPGLKSVVSTFHPDYRKQSVNRSYSKNGAKLGIDYGVRGENEAIDVALPADAEHCARARKIARELAALNPNLKIWLRTNEPPVAKSR